MLQDCNYKKIQQRLIRSDHHNLYSTREKKVALSEFDDKRYLINNIESVPLGHYQIKYAQASGTDVNWNGCSDGQTSNNNCIDGQTDDNNEFRKTGRKRKVSEDVKEIPKKMRGQFHFAP